MEMILNKNDNNIPVDSTTQIYDFLNKELKNKEKTDKSCEEIMKMKFKTKKYYIDSKGKKRKERKGRKYKSDDIRKKIKVKFHKTIKDIINKNLKELGSKKFFKFLPQFFMGNISQKFNYKYLEYSYQDLLLTDFTLCQEEYRNKKIDYNNYLNNKDTIAYLEENEQLSINSGFYLIKDMKYKDMLKAYFSSKQFENSIVELKNKNENIDYIQEYIKMSKNYLNYFSIKKKNGSKNLLNEELANFFDFDCLDNFNKDLTEYPMFFNKNNE
jgi:hypothetical protein